MPRWLEGSVVSAALVFGAACSQPDATPKPSIVTSRPTPTEVIKPTSTVAKLASTAIPTPEATPTQTPLESRRLKVQENLDHANFNYGPLARDPSVKIPFPSIGFAQFMSNIDQEAHVEAIPEAEDGYVQLRGYHAQSLPIFNSPGYFSSIRSDPQELAIGTKFNRELQVIMVQKSNGQLVSIWDPRMMPTGGFDYTPELIVDENGSGTEVISKNPPD